MADYGQLSRLTRRADAVAESASALVSRAIREIRGEIANLSRELNLAGSADDREGVYAMVRRKMDRLRRALDRLLAAQSQAAARGAAEAASGMTGLEVRYSPQRAKAICELVTPAQGESLAAVFTDRMGADVIRALREATVAALRQQAVAGGSMKDLSREMAERWAEATGDGNPVFTDASGRAWNTATYFQMNVRTNTMRVYNDCLADDVARETGSDIMRISRHGSDPHCACAAWEGCIISLTGRTKGLPTYEDARRGGCFHPNCVHTLDYVDEDVDADEIALQMAHPVSGEGAADPDAQDERRYEIDQARKRAENPGMTKEAARVAVDRDNLEAAIRCGLVRGDAAELVAKMTDAQVTALCPDGNPPRFEPVKRVRGGTRKEPKYEPERWNRGRRGGVVHVARDADAQHLLEVCGADGATAEAKRPATAETRQEYIRKIIGGMPDNQRKRLGGAFDNAPIEILRSIAEAKSDTRFDSRNGAYCEVGTTTVHLSETEGWSNNPSTLAHEKGHAVLNSLGQDPFEDVQERFAPIASAAQSETEEWAAKTYGKKWKSECHPKKKNWYAEIGKRVFGFTDDVLTGHTPQMKAAAAMSDVFCAATQGRQFFGHSGAYYRRGAALPTHEITANVTNLLCGAYLEKAREVLPNTIEAVERTVYGIRHNRASSADTSRTNSP